ncbi:MAG TPA: type I restriction enzyme HsdR N-terminal domain-containing protein, partial [Bacteroidia bacterium]|nr:type I restriction enzyme HsdR N-terminal domain-containing protein [Bacteroidia bacterium]
IHNRMGKPWMLIECKAPEVKLNQNAFQQALRYHLNLSVQYLVLSNGMQHFCFEVCNNELLLQKNMPAFPL